MNRTSASIALFMALIMTISVIIPLSVPGEDASAESSDLPSSYDLRDYGLVTSVKNQGNYNTCWAFAFISCAETNLIKKGYADLSVDLSEYQLAYFLIHYTEGPIGGMEGDVVYRDDGKIINGGRGHYTIQETLQWRGLINESDLEYRYIDEYKTINPVYEFDKAAYIVTSARLIDFYDTDAIKKELLDHNSLVTTMPYIKSDFKIITDENGNDSLTFYASEDKKEGYHAVTVVGYDDNYPRENFAEDPGCDGAWLIKNSFGTSTFEGNVMNGYDGYIWISYKSVISFEQDLICVEVEPASDFDKNYQYDGGVESDTIGTNSDKVSSANVFKAVDDGVIRNISFSAEPDGYAGYGYSVSVYTGLTDPNDPCSGTLVAGPLTGTGYYGTVNVDLGKDVPISKGELFSVVVTTDTIASTGHEGFTKMSPVTYDADLSEERGFVIQTTEKPGESFIKHGDGGWTDLCGVGNLRIKAYVCDYRTVNGTVTDGAGNPVASAIVTIVSDGTPYMITCGTDGKYSMKVPSGTCSVTVEKEGYCVYNAYDVGIHDDRDMDITIQSATGSYTVSVECGNGGSTDKDGYNVFEKGTATTVTVTPDDDKAISSIEVNGTAYTASNVIDIDGTESYYRIVITFEDATYSISGCVSDMLGDIMSDVTVTVRYSEGGKTVATSGSDGRYVLNGLGYGRYVMSAEKNGYTSQTLGTIDLNEDMAIDIVMFADGSFSTVTISQNDGGIITPGTSLFRNGDDVTVTIVPDDLYLIKTVTLDGVELGAVDHVDIASISGDHRIDVVFGRQEFMLIFTMNSFSMDPDFEDVFVEIKSETYYVTMYTDKSGTFTLKVPFGTYEITGTKKGMNPATTKVVVDGDKKASIFYEPVDYLVNGNVYDQNGNAINGVDILVDGERECGTITGGRYSMNVGYGLHTITAVKDGYSSKEFTLFVENKVLNKTIVLYETYSIDTECTNGTITGSERIGFNDSFTVSYSPDDGYVLIMIVVDGSDAGTSGHETSYTFDNVDADHMISVIFVPKEFTVTFLDYDGTVISENVYAYGYEITVPADPIRDDDDTHSYRFMGWTPEVSMICESDATYTATYTSVKKDGSPSGMEIAAVVGIAVMTIGLLAVFARGRL